MTEKTSDTLGPLPKAALTVVHNPNTMKRHVSTHGVAYYGSNWYAERECYTADQMRAYALQERAAERERFAGLMTDLRVLAKCCQWPDGDGATVNAQMWAEQWVRRLDVRAKLPAAGWLEHHARCCGST